MTAMDPTPGLDPTEPPPPTHPPPPQMNLIIQSGETAASARCSSRSRVAELMHCWAVRRCPHGGQRQSMHHHTTTKGTTWAVLAL